MTEPADAAARATRGGRGRPPGAARLVVHAVAAGVIVGLLGVAVAALRVRAALALTLVPAEAAIAVAAALWMGWTGVTLADRSRERRPVVARGLVVGSLVLAYLVALGVELLLGMVKLGAAGDVAAVAPPLFAAGALLGCVALPLAVWIAARTPGSDPASLREAAKSMPTTIRDVAVESGLRSGPVLWPVLAAILAVVGSLPVAAISVLLLLTTPPADGDPVVTGAVAVTWAGMSLLAWIALVRWGRQRARLARARREAAMATRRGATGR